jgi:hypothetical protein
MNAGHSGNLTSLIKKYGECLNKIKFITLKHILPLLRLRIFPIASNTLEVGSEVVTRLPAK